MADVQFTEEQYAAAPRRASALSGLTALMISWGLAKDEKAAQIVLMVVAVACVAIAVPVFLGGSDAPPVPRSVIEAALPLEVRGR